MLVTMGKWICILFEFNMGGKASSPKIKGRAAALPFIFGEH